MNPATTTTNGGGRVVSALISPAFSKLGYQSTLQYQTRERAAARAGRPGRHRATRLRLQVAPTMWEFFNTGGVLWHRCTLYVRLRVRTRCGHARLLLGNSEKSGQ